MHKKYTTKLGKWLMEKNCLSICIIDDEEAYFNEKMLRSATRAGFIGIRRFKMVDQRLYNRLVDTPFDIIILDIKGCVHPTVAKDGLALARNLKEHTNSYIAITSAHQFHLSNQTVCADYVIEQRTLTIVDFINELKTIVTHFMDNHMKIYKNIGFRLGFSLAKSSVGAVPPG
jgi:hypothetical protein